MVLKLIGFYRLYIFIKVQLSKWCFWTHTCVNLYTSHPFSIRVEGNHSFTLAMTLNNIFALSVCINCLKLLSWSGLCDNQTYLVEIKGLLVLWPNCTHPTYWFKVRSAVNGRVFTQLEGVNQAMVVCLFNSRKWKDYCLCLSS